MDSPFALISPAEERAQLRQYDQQYRHSVDTVNREATEAAATATKAVSRGALLGALYLVLGAVAAWFGGRMGAVDPTVTRMRAAWVSKRVARRDAQGDDGQRGRYPGLEQSDARDVGRIQ